MTGLIVPCYNRSEALRQMLNSLREADLSDILLILINDASTDEETNRLFAEFHIKGAAIMKYTNEKNKGIKFNLKLGYEKAFEMCDIAMNLDSDAIVKKDFVSKLLNLKKQFPENIVTGFNCRNKTYDGNERHSIIDFCDGYIKKSSVGGINMVVTKEQYEKWILPSLQQIDNWDKQACISSMKDGKEIICITPSVVQHIGYVSSMGHHEEPDVAWDFDEKLNLPDVTLIGVDSVHPHLLNQVAEISQRNINFGAVKLITDQDIKSKEAYSEFLIKEIYKYVDTSHLLIIQHDGYILNHKAWSDEFLNYDYIGGTWWFKDNMNVGNGGFSLRSKKLMKIVSENFKDTHPEDFHICRTHRKYLESEHGIKFAPEEVANRFSIEAHGISSELGARKYNGQFGFHGYNADYTTAKIPHTPKGRPHVPQSPEAVVSKKSTQEIIDTFHKKHDPFFRW